MTNKIRMETTGIAGRTPADVREKCAVARELENAGDYEGARETLADIWRGIGQRPDIERLSPKDAAEVLLRAGTISGWLGTSGQIPGAQEFAKDLISESIRAFERLADRDKLAEAQTDLAICYWREGAIDEARVWFSEALTRAKAPTNQFRVLSIALSWKSPRTDLPTRLSCWIERRRYWMKLKIPPSRLDITRSARLFL